MLYRVICSLLVVVVLGFLALVTYEDKPRPKAAGTVNSSEPDEQRGLKAN